MTTFEQRDQAFEKKFANDAEAQFKLEARRNKLLALWAADLLGKNEAESTAYIQEVIVSDFEEPGDEDVLRKVLADLDAGGLNITHAELRKQMDMLMGEAKQQLVDEAS